MLTMDYSFSGGVAIKFSARPGEEIRGALKASGYRWSTVTGQWWKRSARGAADFLTWLEKAIDRENGVRRPDGTCWNCKSEPGYFRNRGAAAPVICDSCHERVET